MTEKHFFADAEAPFHVWVRERSGTQGARWVLRHASQVSTQLRDAESSYNRTRTVPTPRAR